MWVSFCSSVKFMWETFFNTIFYELLEDAHDCIFTKVFTKTSYFKIVHESRE